MKERAIRNRSMAGSNPVPGRAGKRNLSLFSDKALYSQINFWLLKPLVKLTHFLGWWRTP